MQLRKPNTWGVTLTFCMYKVEWRPYTRDQVVGLNLSTLCKADEDLWTMKCPLICFYAVEYHLPYRVAWQFGKLQPCPLEPFSTSWDLHKKVLELHFTIHESQFISYLCIRTVQDGSQEEEEDH
jgi:hypothetical protein